MTALAYTDARITIDGKPLLGIDVRDVEYRGAARPPNCGTYGVASSHAFEFTTTLDAAQAAPFFAWADQFRRRALSKIRRRVSRRKMRRCPWRGR